MEYPILKKALASTLRAFMEAVLAYTGAEQIDVISHSLGVGLTRGIIKGEYKQLRPLHLILARLWVRKYTLILESLDQIMESKIAYLIKNLSPVILLMVRTLVRIMLKDQVDSLKTWTLILLKKEPEPMPFLLLMMMCWVMETWSGVDIHQSFQRWTSPLSSQPLISNTNL